MIFSANTPWKAGFSGRSSGPFPRRSGEIAAVVLGFVFAWPAALAYVVWKIAGYPLPRDWRASIEGLFGRRLAFAGFGGGGGRFAGPRSGNWAFEAYRRGEIERLEKERRRLEEEGRAFSRFVEELRRAKDREEFDAFTRQRRAAQAGQGPTIDA